MYHLNQLQSPIMKRNDPTPSLTFLLFLLIFHPHSVVAVERAASFSLARLFLVPQNAARAAVKMRPLAWDQKLAHYAEAYAERRRWDCASKHSDGPYGENIFWGSSGGGWSPAEAVAAWISELRWYNYRANSCAEGQECGHYTQIVWGATRRVGCAKVVCVGDKGVFMTCNYDPPGNYIGQRPY